MSARRILARVALAALTFGAVDTAEATSSYEPTAIGDALEDELSDWNRGMRARVLGVVGADTRAEVRLHAARHLAEVGLPLPGPARRLVRSLAADRSQVMREELARSIRRLCRNGSPLEATQLLSNGCTSRSMPMRALMARVLARDIDYIGLPDALDYLAQTGDADVRHETALAAACRIHETPAYAAILARLAEDRDHRVAAVAADALAELDLVT
jgi:hypothetical protein